MTKMAGQHIARLQHFAGYETRSCRYGFFDRHGGVSDGAFSSLNIGMAVGDSEAAVAANRQLVKRCLRADCLISAHQVHGDRVYQVGENSGADLEVEGYDALITRQTGVGLIVQHADCQAVLLYDPVHEAIGAVHSGWRGSVANIIAATVGAMNRAFATDPADLQTVISPSLGPCCAEFVNYAEELPTSFLPFMDNRKHFDFWQISKRQLLSCGVRAQAIAVSAICTSCSPDYFSYRRACREKRVTGRNCSGIVLTAR
ncbi:MAG: peptidoglycan editing factor PgeF [Desulfopila sp.]